MCWQRNCAGKNVGSNGWEHRAGGSGLTHTHNNVLITLCNLHTLPGPPSPAICTHCQDPLVLQSAHTARTLCNLHTLPGPPSPAICTHCQDPLVLQSAHTARTLCNLHTLPGPPSPAICTHCQDPLVLQSAHYQEYKPAHSLGGGERSSPIE